MNKGLAEKIFELREQGLSYREVETKLGCSRSLISYHCGTGQKDKTLNRQRKDRKENVVRTKVHAFVGTKPRRPQKNKKDKREIKKILQVKITQFCLNGKRKDKSVRCKLMFKVQDLIDKIGDDPICYLTGRPINLEEGRSYQLDHILPKSRGGDNSLENCGLTCKLANQSKTNLTVEEFVQLCREVVERHKSN